MAGLSLKKFILLTFALTLMTVSLASDKEAPEIQTLMAPEDFTAAGLDKLTDAERAHLSEWVARYREGAVKGPPVPGKQRKEAAAAAATEAAAEAGAEQESTQLAAEESAPATTDEYPGEYTTQKEKKKKKKDKVKFELRAKVIPEFRGWSGKSVFVLDNGQVWRQRTPGSMRYSGGDSNIIITQNWMGKFIMNHPASGRSVGVRRID
jgi:hypothetical protein